MRPFRRSVVSTLEGAGFASALSDGNRKAIFVPVEVIQRPETRRENACGNATSVTWRRTFPDSAPGTDGVAIFEGRVIGRVRHLTDLPRDPEPAGHDFSTEEDTMTKGKLSVIGASLAVVAGLFLFRMLIAPPFRRRLPTGA
jgi:hypothetical protein